MHSIRGALVVHRHSSWWSPSSATAARSAIGDVHIFSLWISAQSNFAEHAEDVIDRIGSRPKRSLSIVCSARPAPSVCADVAANSLQRGATGIHATGALPVARDCVGEVFCIVLLIVSVGAVISFSWVCSFAFGVAGSVATRLRRRSCCCCQRRWGQ